MNPVHNACLIAALAAMCVACASPSPMKAPAANRPVATHAIDEDLAYLKSRGARFDPHVRQVEDFAHVETLYCDDYFDDRCMEIISRRTPQLRVVSLMFSKVTDAGAAYFTRMPRLEEAILFYSKVSDNACKHLSAVKTLHSIDLSGTEVTDAGLAEFSSLSSLRWLNICDSKITHAGVQRLSAMNSLLQIDHDLDRPNR